MFLLVEPSQVIDEIIDLKPIGVIICCMISANTSGIEPDI